MTTRRMALAVMAMGLMLAPRASWAQTNLGGAASEQKTAVATIDIEKYGEFWFTDHDLDMTVDTVQLAGGANATPVSDIIAFSASANTDITVSTPATIVLAGPSATNLTADVEMDRLSQTDHLTVVLPTSNVQTAVPSGDNSMVLRVTVDPAAHSNSPTGKWSVLLPAGAYVNTTSLVVTMVAN